MCWPTAQPARLPAISAGACRYFPETDREGVKAEIVKAAREKGET